MQHTSFVEAMSADPFVRRLHRNAIRLLNDPSLDRQQREFHIRRIQSLLLEHQAKQEAKAQKKAAKEATRDQVSRNNRNQGVADPSQVAARRKEFGVAARQQEALATTQGDLMAESPQLETAVVAAANDSQAPGRNRPVLKLKRA